MTSAFTAKIIKTLAKGKPLTYEDIAKLEYPKELLTPIEQFSVTNKLDALIRAGIVTHYFTSSLTISANARYKLTPAVQDALLDIGCHAPEGGE